MQKPKLQTVVHRDGKLTPDWNDIVQSTGDSVGFNVVSLYLNDIARTLTGSRDILLFAEIYQNAAAGQSEKPLSTLIYTAENQMIPGRANFSNPLAFGPTTFSGHPLKVKFTVLVLQRRQVTQGTSAVDTIKTFSAGFGIASPYMEGIQVALSLVKSILRSQPDVVTFDFEATFMAFRAEGFASGIGGGASSDKLSNLTKNAMPVVASLNQTGLTPDSDTVTIYRMTTTDSKDLGVLPSTHPQRTSPVQVTVGDLRKEITDSVLQQCPDATPELVNLAVGIRIRSQSLEMATKYLREIQDDFIRMMWIRSHEITENRAKDVLGKYQLISSETVTLHAINDLLDVILRSDKSYLLHLAFPGRTLGSFSDGSLITQFPWMRYGLYAMVQTAQAGGNVEQGPRVTPLVGDGRSMFFDGGYVYSNSDRSDLINASYLVFSLTPGLRPEASETLAAASTADVARIANLRIDPTKPAESLQELSATVESLRSKVIEMSGDRLAADVAQTIADSNGGKVVDSAEWKSKFETAWATYSTRFVGAEPAKLAAVRDSIIDKWTRRIDLLKPRPVPK